MCVTAIDGYDEEMRWAGGMLAGLMLLPCCSSRSSSGSRPCVAPAEGTPLTVGGISFVERSMTSIEYPATADADTFAEINISASTDACNEALDGERSKDASTTEIRLLTFEINSAKVGTFCVAAFGSAATRSCAWARVLVRPAGTPSGKGPSQAVDADTGSITITAMDPTHIAGSYDVHFITGERVARSFDAPTCGVAACSP